MGERQQTFVPVGCCKCGVVFGMPSDFYSVMCDSGDARSWYCPNGHQQHFVYEKTDDDGGPDGEEEVTDENVDSVIVRFVPRSAAGGRS